MPSLMTLEDAVPKSHMIKLWQADERPPPLGGTNAITTWFEAQPLPVAAALAGGLSIGVGFALSSLFLLVIGHKSSAPPIAGARRRRRRS